MVIYSMLNSHFHGLLSFMFYYGLLVIYLFPVHYHQLHDKSQATEIASTEHLEAALFAAQITEMKIVEMHS